MKSLAMIVITITLVACAGIGQKFDVAKVDELKPGVSTFADATELLGKPMAESQNADGSKVVKWMYSRGTPVGGYGANVQILFGADGKMVRVVHKAAVGV